MVIGRDSTLHIFLREKLSRSDAVLMKILESQNQAVIARVLKCYSTRFEGPGKYETVTLEFVGEMSAWGNVPLKTGETALVFIKWLSGSEKYYQDHWHGHFTIEEIKGIKCAVANWQLLQGKCEPEELRNTCFLPDPDISWRVALPFQIFEQCLLDEINASSSDI